MPTLANITVMNLRSSYGAMMMMMKAYRDGKMFREVDEDQFLQTMAKQMNASVEQLHTTYIGIGRRDYETSARNLVEALASTIGTAHNGHEAEDVDNVDEFFK